MKNMIRLLLVLIFFFLFLVSISLSSPSVKALDVIAKSGYWRDIQEAVDLVAASGGGNVYIPEGTFNFVNVNESWTGARVIIPAGVNLFGARTERYENGSVVEWKTILVLPWDMPGDKSYVPPHWFLITGNRDPSKPSRFSDVALIGYREFNHSAKGYYLGIRVSGVINFRIDHCRLKEIPDGIFVGVGWDAQPASGVIDHCKLENDYGIPDPYDQRTTGYGINVYRSESIYQWPNIQDIAGKYNDYTVFIEDCYFTKWRHCVLGNHGAHYVMRHCKIEHGWAYGEVDQHPIYTSPQVACRLAEIYDNQFINLDDWTPTANLLIAQHAGSVIVFNNYFNAAPWGNNNGYWSLLQINKGVNYNSSFDPQNNYLWNNSYSGTPAALVDGGIENVDYFLYKPEWYTPYPYPHPLTLEGIRYPVNVTGVVRDSSNGLAVQNAIVSCNNTFNSTTNSTGGYFLSLPIAAPFSCNLTVSKEGYLSNSTIISFSSNGSYTRNFYITQLKLSKITGRLIDKNNNPLNANITVYLQGSVIASNKTDSNGYYYLAVSSGIYDIQFNFSSSNFVKLISVNASSDVSNLVGRVSFEINRSSIEVENNYTKRIEVYSDKRPSDVKINRTSVPSWSYDLSKRIININLSAVIAKSGRAEDIQEAVDLVALMGGGIVYVPEGNYSINPEDYKLINNYPGYNYAAVVIPGGVSIIGAGENKTILKLTGEPPRGGAIFYLRGENGLPSRISRISFIGYVNYSKTCRDDTRCDEYLDEPEYSSTNGIVVSDAKDFRIDHCYFEDFTSNAIATGNSNYPSAIFRGVIDHCKFVQRYKYFINKTQWGYCVGVFLDYYSWEEDITKILGKYNETVFVEDSYFEGCRHHVAANGGAHYVFRYNYLTKVKPENYNYIDAHGSSGNPPAVGTRAIEVYSNIIEDSPCPLDCRFGSGYIGSYLGVGIAIRGGGGVVFNNTFNKTKTGISLSTDAVNPKCITHDVWIWNNTFIDVPTQINPGNAVENVDYFLYKPDWYTPYPYPHPLTLE